MKIKFSWIPFIPVVVLSVILRVYQKLFIDSGIDTGFLSTEMAWVVYTGLVAFLFLVLVILCCADRKTAPECQIGKNFFAGLFGVLTAGVVIFNAGVSLGSFILPQNASSMTVSIAVDILFGLLGGIAIFVMAISSFSGKNIAKKMGVFSVVAPLWCCVEMTLKFIEYTRQSIHSFDMTNLFYMAFMTLAVFNLSMVYQGVKCKNPVKGTFLYGMPGFVVTIVYAVANLINQITMTGTYDVMGSLDIISFVLLSFYVLFMMIELTSKAHIKETKADNNDAKPLIQLEETKTDEISEEEIKKSNKHVEITDVEDDINKDLNGVENVIDAMEQEENDPEKYNPLSQEYFDSHSANVVEEDDEISQSLANIDKLIEEINAGE